MNRRLFIQTSIAGAAMAWLTQSITRGIDVASAAEQAHGEIWRRFINRYGIMVDLAGLDGSVNSPTPEECRDGKPNALGWNQPISNGAMFNGLYIEAALDRWRASQKSDDAEKARRLMKGLLFLNSISDVKGFVGRGVSTDGKSHYPMGSNDQTGPWFLGLWRYWSSKLASEAERAEIKSHLTTTAEEIVRLGWRMPAEAPFKTRGSFAGFHFDEVARLLFVAKLMHVMTGDAKWQEIYAAELQKVSSENGLSKLQICEQGMKFQYGRMHNWTTAPSVGALRGLWEMETGEKLKASYASGLKASALLAAEALPLALKFDPLDEGVVDQDWRKSMLPLWKPQKTDHEATTLADLQLRAFSKTSPKRYKETTFVREPVSAAWIITLCPDGDIRRRFSGDIEAVVTRYDYSKLYYSAFFWAEMAWRRLHGAA